MFTLIGYFASLNIEFQMRKENISITIMPLGLVYTEQVLKKLTANYNSFMEPGITTKVSLSN